MFIVICNFYVGFFYSFDDRCIMQRIFWFEFYFLFLKFFLQNWGYLFSSYVTILQCMIQDKTLENWNTSSGSMPNFCYQTSENKWISYIVDPIENKESTEEFMNRTEGDLIFSKRACVSFALYYLVLIGESIMRIFAFVLSTPITSPRA